MNIGTKSALAALAISGALGAMTAHSIAQQREGHERHEPNRHRAPPSPEDRAAFLDARLAGVHAGLRLTADQEKLWQPVEAAARDKAQTMMELMDKNRSAGRPMNPIEGLKRRAEADTAKGLADKKLADAAQPLWNTLTDQQKHRFERLAHGMILGGGEGRPDGARNGPRGPQEGPMHRHEGRPLEDYAPPPASRPAPPPR